MLKGEIAYSVLMCWYSISLLDSVAIFFFNILYQSEFCICNIIPHIHFQVIEFCFCKCVALNERCVCEYYQQGKFNFHSAWVLLISICSFFLLCCLSFSLLTIKMTGKCALVSDGFEVSLVLFQSDKTLEQLKNGTDPQRRWQNRK